jgi:hypothetical protein
MSSLHVSTPLRRIGAAAVAAALLAAGPAAGHAGGPVSDAAQQRVAVSGSGWEPAEAWAHTADEHTAASNAQIKQVFAWAFGEVGMRDPYGTLRGQRDLANGRVQRTFDTVFTVESTGETVYVSLFLPGGWEQGINRASVWDDRLLLWCPEGDRDVVDCRDGRMPGGARYGWVETRRYVESVVYFADGSAADILWAGAGGAPPLVTGPDVLFAAAHLDTAPVWRALDAETGVAV